MNKVLLTLAALLMWITPAQSAEFDLESWLDEPDVKLVAVEFYADWCVPCKASAPRWEALRKKYAPDGLKLVVVNLSESPGGGAKRCTRLPWNPDESLCDPELGEKLGVKGLPEAFLWSWQGNLLVERGQHVDEIERIIRRYLDDNPRVQIAALNTNGKSDKTLQRQVESALSRSGKLTIVPDAEMQKRLAAVRKASHGATKRDDQRCAIGAEVSPNSLLTAERFEGALSLTMADAETGCQRATTSVAWNDAKAERTIEKAVYKLMAQMKRRGGVQMPAGSAFGKQKRKKRAKVGVEDMTDDEDDEWVPEEEELASVKFTSDPEGAKVILDGELLCKKTPCRRDVEPGRHQVEMKLDRYAPLKRAVSLEAGQMVGWSLTPTFATLSVRTEPAGVEVTVDGESVGKTPIDGLEVAEGKHTVEVGGRCHKKKKQRLNLPRGKSHTVKMTMKARKAGLKVRAIDPKGDSVTADVFLDGERLGETPKTFGVGLCASELEVRHSDYGTWRKELSLVEKKTQTVTAELSVSRAEARRRVRADKKARKQAKKKSARQAKKRRASAWDEDEDEDRPDKRISLKQALRTHHFPDCDAEIGEGLWYFSDLLFTLPLLYMPFRAMDAPSDEANLWWGYWGMKFAGWSLPFVLIPAFIDEVDDPDTFGYSVLGAALATILASNIIFVPLIEEEQRTHCYKKKLAGLSCDLPQAPEPPQFTLAPLILPDPSGATVYGMTGGFQF